MRLIPRSYFIVSFTVPILFLCSGCGEPTVCKVSGTVKVGGKPVSGITVNFVPADGRSSWGLTDSEGRYKLHHARDQEGALRGTHKVSFSYRPSTPVEELEFREGKAALAPEVKTLLEKYGDPSSTTLTYEVTKNGQVIDINLD